MSKGLRQAAANQSPIHPPSREEHDRPQAQHSADLVRLRDVGLKATPHRLTVLQAFHASEVRHLSAEDLYRSLVAQQQDIGLATVYLAQFEAAGILRRNHFDQGKAVFELKDAKQHYHLVCLGCGCVTEFYDPEIDRRQRDAAQRLGFEVREESLALFGTCAKQECRERAAKRLHSDFGHQLAS
jgi:Fur family ferric uptake transcriptional regulator